MKNEKFGKLSLKKETVARLSGIQMNEVKGGTLVEAITQKCYVLNPTFKTIPPCTISIKEVIIDKVIRY